MLVIVVSPVPQKGNNVIAKVIVPVLVGPLLKLDEEHCKESHFHP